MDNHSLHVLEWGKIREIIADLASFSLGKKLVLELEPQTEFSFVKQQLDLTTAALELLWKYSVPPFGGAVDISSILHRARIGGLLNGEELLKLAGVLQCIEKMRHYLGKSADFTWYIEQLIDLPHVKNEINRCLDDEAQVKDRASSQLAAIRQRKRSLANKVADKLDNIIHSSSNQKLLQESIVTIRNGRYVVPVKQEYRSIFGGIVHDQSSSGATLFIEPTVVVEINNQLRITQQEETKEIDRILRKLSDLVRPEVDTIEVALDTLAKLDMLFAKAKYSKQIHGTAPKLNNKGYISIKKGRHPLLTGNVVPIDLWIGDQFSILVITGPNTGGKTVTLKTVGLFAVMTQAGVHIPADEGSQMAVFDNIFADIGDEQSIEQSLSTFSSHMNNIVEIIKQLTNNSLVLLDELGAGTDPTEGAALATVLLEYLRDKKVKAIATTHYSELKNFAYENPEVENASVEFDLKTLKPTYRLSIGIPGKSNAFSIAQSLGLPTEIVTAARSLLSEERIQADDIISEMETNRRLTDKARREAEELRLQYEQYKTKYEKMECELKEQKQAIISEANEQAEMLIKQKKQELDLLIGELRQQQNIDLEKIVADKRSELIEQQKRFRQSSKKPAISSTPPKELKPGELVKVLSLNQTGQILELTDDEAVVQIGIMRVSVPLTDTERAERKQQTDNKRNQVSSKVKKSDSIRPEIHVRGLTIEETTVAVDKYLDDAFLSSLTQVRIVHGKGTGALRDAVGRQLRTHPHVKSFRLAEPSQGGSGVTVVELNRMN